jgi:catechol 2,3-dioxygenase-like lactoylglutathione lyase family enzyme
MNPQLNIITLGVSDLFISKNFYINCFGWKPMNENDGIVFFLLNGVILSLYPVNKLAEDANISPEGMGFKKFTLAYTCKSADEVDSVFQDVLSKGAKLVKAPEKVFWGGYSCYVADPDDNLWEIAYNPFLLMDDAGNVLGEIHE